MPYPLLFEKPKNESCTIRVHVCSRDVCFASLPLELTFHDILTIRFNLSLVHSRDVFLYCKKCKMFCIHVWKCHQCQYNYHKSGIAENIWQREKAQYLLSRIAQTFLGSSRLNDTHKADMRKTLQWRHNERDGVSNHQPHDCLLNRIFKTQIK